MTDTKAEAKHKRVLKDGRMDVEEEEEIKNNATLCQRDEERPK